MKALSIAATGMSAQQMRVDVISQNLANMSTTGYNARRAEFADLAYDQLAPPGTLSSDGGTMLPTGIQMGMGVRPVAVSVILAQGTMAQTGGDLDLGIDGPGYLEVTLPSGTSAYTRDGALKRGADGQIVTSQGYPLVPSITIPPETRALTINADGQVYASFDGQVDAQLLGQITLTGFTNEKGLLADGGNLFRESPASGPPLTGVAGTNGLGILRQHYLEESAVDPVSEVTELIKAQRGYELNSKVITAADQMLATTTQVR